MAAALRPGGVLLVEEPSRPPLQADPGWAGAAEYERLLRFYPRHGYEVMVLPKVATAERASFVLANL